MKIVHSKTVPGRRKSSDIVGSLSALSSDYLRQAVERIAVPRHAVAERANNRGVAEWIKTEFESFGYDTRFEGRFDNVIAMPYGRSRGSFLLVGAHYDSVPGCPGADDNASAVAVMLACAKAVADLAADLPVCFVAFNCEEDGFVGSFDFVDTFLPAGSIKVAGCHILEMVGYCSQEKGSQRVPPGIPTDIPDTGNFIGLLGDSTSRGMVDEVLSAGKTYLPDFPVIGLKLYLGAERLLPDLNRSDHVPFWRRGIPAVMWTDTADFRNPNYHRSSDTPETLDYNFMANVARLLIASLL